MSPFSTVALAQQPSTEIDQDVRKLVLDVQGGTKLDTRIDQSLVDGEVERTIDGASTLTFTVHDPKRALLQSGMFDQKIDVTLDNLHWRLVKVSKSDDDLTLTFEDRAVAYLREITAPKKAARAKMTRAEFAYSLVREVKKGGGIEFFCPELHDEQPIAKDTQKTKPAERKATKGSGINPDTAGLTIKGAKATKSQLANAERLLDVAASLNAPEKAQMALIECAMNETSIQNLPYGDADSRGILQLQDKWARALGIDNMDIEACANGFLKGWGGTDGAIEFARANPGASIGDIIVHVQHSSMPGGPSAYSKYEKEAQAIVNAYGGGSDDGTTLTSTKVIHLPYQYRRGGEDGTQEDTWACLQRLAEEVNWRCFVTAGVCYFISDRALIKAKPSMVLTETSPGVTSIDFDIDEGKAADTVTVNCRTSRWVAAPGAVVLLSDLGPADGRWLVSDLRRGIYDANATITLTRAQKPLPEPAADTTTTTTSADGTTTTAGDTASIAAAAASGDPLARLYQCMQNLTARRFPYVWAGGHASAGTPTGGGFDCSGSVGAVLACAGLGFQLGQPVPDSGTMAASWGEAGPGQRLTMYANGDHVFLVLDGHHFGTGDWGKGWNGPGLNPNMHFTNGFTPRHWPGL